MVIHVIDFNKMSNFGLVLKKEGCHVRHDRVNIFRIVLDLIMCVINSWTKRYKWRRLFYDSNSG